MDYQTKTPIFILLLKNYLNNLSRLIAGLEKDEI